MSYPKYWCFYPKFLHHPLIYEVNDAGCWVLRNRPPNKNKDRPYISLFWVRHSSSNFIYRLYKWEIGDWLCVRHICDNPMCINPDHLILWTNQDNINDKVRRKWKLVFWIAADGLSKWENNVNATLNRFDVVKIFYESWTHKDIAVKYNTSRSTVTKIKNKTAWLDVVKDL